MFFCPFHSTGEVESTEATYRYHMQVQETPNDSVIPAAFKEGSLKDKLKPSKRRSHSRSHSSGSQDPPNTPLSPKSPGDASFNEEEETAAVNNNIEEKSQNAVSGWVIIERFTDG